MASSPLAKRWGAAVTAAAAILAAVASAGAEPLTIEQFREQLVSVPLCGTPDTGPLKGKHLCTVHLPDGAAVVAGGVILVRGLWDADGDRICRRSQDDPLERRRCVTYERVDATHSRNSDGVLACVGPCPAPERPQAQPSETKPAQPQEPAAAIEPAPAQSESAPTDR